MNAVTRIGLVLVALLLSGGTEATPYWTNGVPAATPPLTGNEKFPADTYLSGSTPPQQEAISVAQLKTFINGGTVVLCAGTPGQGAVLYYSGACWAILAPGSSGQFLETQGAAANAVWASLTGGGNANFGTVTGNVSGDLVSMSNTTTGVQDSGVPAAGNETDFSGLSSGGTGQPSGTAVMCGFGGTIKLTPSFSGRVRLVMAGTVAGNTGNAGALMALRYGTGTAPANGDAVTGTAFGAQSNGFVTFNNGYFPLGLVGVASGLTKGTQYWFDCNGVQTTNATIWSTSGVAGYVQEF